MIMRLHGFRNSLGGRRQSHLILQGAMKMKMMLIAAGRGWGRDWFQLVACKCERRLLVQQPAQGRLGTWQWQIHMLRRKNKR